VLYGADFWSKVLNLDYLVESGMISADDLGLFKICSTVEEAFAYVTKGLNANSGAKTKKKKSKRS
jgi:predicted Rossmann-fold nucleotide-binding protein